MTRTRESTAIETPESIFSQAQAGKAALSTFRDMVASPVFHPDDVEKWVRSAQIRVDLFSDLVVGKIRWPRSLGRPRTESLFEGFRVKPTFVDAKVKKTPEHPEGETITLTGPLLDMRLRDGPDDADHCWIQYEFRRFLHKPSMVEVWMADVPWDHSWPFGLSRTLYLSSHGFDNIPADPGFVALPDITVSDRPFVHP